MIKYLILICSIMLFNCNYSKINSVQLFVNEIINARFNNTLIEIESKNKNKIDDKDIIIPNIIEFKILKKINILYKPKIIIAVLSSPHNFRKRYSFRANSKKLCNKTTKCLYIFFIASSNFENHRLLEKESYIYNDIVKFAFQNSYLNLTILSIMALKYCYRYFEYIDFYLKTDDDIIINFRLMYSVLKKINKTSRNIYGHYSNKFKVNRINSTKAYIPYSQYPYKFAPPYVYGAFIIITHSSFISLNNEIMNNQHFVWKEDVNLGILCKKCNLSVKKLPFNIYIIFKSKKCNASNNELAIENYYISDNFYCSNIKSKKEL